MSENMYDEKGCLKSEYFWTESEIKAMLLNTEYKFESLKKEDYDKIRAVFNKKVKSIQEDILKNQISFKKFENAYYLLKAGSKAGLIDNPLAFALTLSRVIVANDEQYQSYAEDIKNIIAWEIRKSLGDNVNSLVDELNILQNKTSLYIISLNDYCSFCDKLELAMMAQIDNIDYVKCLDALIKAKMQEPKTYDEYIRYLNHFEKVVEMSIQTLQSKGFLKR